MAWLRGAVLVALAAASPLLLGQLRDEARADGRQERLYYPSGRFLQEASLGFDAPAADYLWLQTVQYYGAFRRGEHDLRYFDGLVRAVTTLDPRFVEAYHFYSLVLCLDEGAYDRAIDVLKQGILANPGSWELHFNVGFVNYVFLRNDLVASQYFATAAELPGATDFCRRFAAFARKRGGDLEGSLLLWRNLRETTDSQDMRDLADTMIEKCERALGRRGDAS